MHKGWVKRLQAGLALGLACVMLCACIPGFSSSIKPTPEGTYSVDPLLREYYESLDPALIGPAISGMVTYNTSQCQFTANALLCFDANASGSQRYYLAPLGIMLQLEADPAPPPFTVYPDFQPVIAALGAMNVGQPLTAAHTNYEKQRVEQYFERVGFYQRLDDPQHATHLLPYGAYVCDVNCRYQVPDDQAIISRNRPSSSFLAVVEALGGEAFAGEPLTDIYLTATGDQEQIFDNIVLYSPAGFPEEVFLRPLPRLMGMLTESPGPLVYGPEYNVIFIIIAGEAGYHVPVIFDAYIQQHGGMGVSGLPIAGALLYPDENNIPRQCFENYCLDYHAELPAGEQVQLAPLGRRYLQQIGTPEAAAYVLTPDTVLLQVSEESAQVTSSESQTIHAVLVGRVDYAPIAGVMGQLTVVLPDGIQQVYTMPATDGDGQTSVVLPPFIALQNGSPIRYQACVQSTDGISPPICAQDAFLIWNY